MEPPGGRDSRFNLGNYGGMNLLSGDGAADMYPLGRPSTSLQQLSPRHHAMVSCGGRAIKSDVCYDDRGMSSQAGLGPLDPCATGSVNDMSDDTYSALQAKKSPPSNGKKTKGRVKIKMEYIENKLRRYTTFSKRKTGIMKKAYELSTLTGTQVMLLVASETGHVYTFATRKLQPMITSEAGKALIQTCLNSPDPPGGGGGGTGGDQRMSATGFEETELTYNISDEDSKDENMSPADMSSDSSDGEMAEPPEQKFRIPTTTSSILQPTASKPSSRQTSPPSNQTKTTTLLSNQQPSSSSSSSITSKPSPLAAAAAPATSTTTTTTPSSTAQLMPPLLYQTPQGMMYATPSNGGVILSLAQPGDGTPGLGQYITIPLSMVTGAAPNGQVELDLSAKRK